MIPLPYFAGGALALAVASGVGGYLAGDSAGANRVLAREARATAKATAALERGRAAIDALNGRLAAAQTAQTTEQRSIRNAASGIVFRPIFRQQCVDAAGGELLDRARDAANADPAREPADPAPAAPGDAAGG